MIFAALTYALATIGAATLVFVAVDGTHRLGQWRRDRIRRATNKLGLPDCRVVDLDAERRARGLR